MNEKLDIIFGRRSIRSYQEKEIGDEVVETLLRAAMAAPSCCCTDPWRFIVVRNKETLSRIAEGLPNGKMLPSANVGIVVCGDTDAAHDRLLSYMLQDCSAAVENMLLAAHGLGLGACWLGVHPRESRVAHVKEVCSIPDPVIPVAVIALGYPAEKSVPRTRFTKEYIHSEKW
jgi:nitroreductase